MPFSFPTMLLDPNDRWGHMDGWGPMGAGGWMWLWGLLLLIGIIVLIVVGILALTRGGSSRDGGGRSRAREILDERYARGELTTEEYRERLQELK